MRVLVCGGRDYNDLATARAVLDSLRASRGIDLVIEGGALGADRVGRLWAQTSGVHVATVSALWDAYGKRAGMLRNAAMLLLQPDLVVAFRGGAGTANMIKQARAAGVEVWEL